MSGYRGRGRGRGRGTLRRDGHYKDFVNYPLGSLQGKNQSSARPSNSSKHVTNRITINLALDVATEAWFTQFRNMWNLLKKSPPVSTMLYNHFDNTRNPYEQALRLMYNCPDFKNSKIKSLAFMIMEDFKIYSTSSRNKIISLLTIDIKISAFNIVRAQGQFLLMKMVSEIYEMMADCYVFLDIIKQMIENKEYKDACQCATLLRLHNKFGVEEFLVPLILQDKLVLVEDFISSSSQHQYDLVARLDSMLGQLPSIRPVLEDYVCQHEIPEVNWGKLSYKPFRKLIVRLIKIYNLPSDVSPCLNKKRNEGALNFLLNKRFVDQTFGYEGWREMVEEAVTNDAELQKQLVVQVAAYGDAPEALWWAKFYKIPREYWPYTVRMFHDNPDEDRHQQKSSRSSEEENWHTASNSKADYLKLDLPRDRIYLIDNAASFETFLNCIKDDRLVGVDCEWKPSFGVQMNELALMQIASRTSVYILDTIVLAHQTPQLWQQLGKTLFNNCDVLKLGFSFTSDTSMILQSLPNLSFNQSGGFLDLLSLWKQIDRNPRVKLPHEVQSGGASLSTLVQLCLGHPLDKSDQFSNWEKRPLRPSQLEYAALDAYCLIQIYDVLQRCCGEVDYPFEDTCYNLMTVPKGKKKKSKTNLRKSKDGVTIIPQPPSPHYKQRPADRISFVCDTMLQGLGKAMRRCGINTHILENSDDHKECVRYYQDEQRYILTRGSAFYTLMGYVTTGHCFHVQSDDVDEQLKKVLEYFNVIVTKDHVFSRCQACNSNGFVKVSKSTMNAIAQEQRKAKRQEYEQLDLADEATGWSSSDDDDLPGVPISCTRKWEVSAEDKIDFGLCMTRNGAKILIDEVPPTILEKQDIFYICEDCGKVYWDGSHFERVLSNRLQGIVLS